MSHSLRGAWEHFAGAVAEALSAKEDTAEHAAAKVKAAREKLTAASLAASLQLRDAEQILQINKTSFNSSPSPPPPSQQHQAFIMEESAGEQNQAWPYPIYVGHTRRLLPTDELFQDTSYAHDEGTKTAARASATATERNSSHEKLQERSLARDFLVPKHDCTLCRALLPTAHLLDLHLSEVHDSFFAAQAARKMPVYACLVESCLKKFCTIEQRKQHLMDFHKFPKGYNLDRIHLRRKKGQIRPLPQYQKGKKNNTSEEPSPPPVNANAEPRLSAEPMEEDLAEGMSRLRMSASISVVPRSVAFGHRGRGGLMPGLVRGSKGSSQSGGGGAGGGRGEKGEMASAGGDKDIEMNKE